MPALWETWQQGLCFAAIIVGAFLMGVAHGRFIVEARLRRLARRYTHRCFCGWKSPPCTTMDEAKAHVHAHIREDEKRGTTYVPQVRP